MSEGNVGDSCAGPAVYGWCGVQHVMIVDKIVHIFAATTEL